MKKAFLILIALVSFTAIEAQVKEGTIVYERKINMHRAIQDEQMKAMLPEFRITRHTLLFSDSMSVYKMIPEDEAPDPFAGGGPRIVLRMGAGDDGELYKNFSQARSVLTSELGGKNFLIVDSIKQQPWKLGTETKQILGYHCLKATRKILVQTGGGRRIMMGGGPAPREDTIQVRPREVEVAAWYAENIVSPAGPESFGQLPGAILQLDIDNGGTVYLATEIKKTVDAKELKEPKKGKIITQAEFTKMRQELMNTRMPGR